MVTTPTKPSDISSLEARLEEQKARLRDLATMGTDITAIHDIDAVLSVVMDMALQLVRGEVGLLMVAEDQQLRTRISWGVNESFIRGLMYTDTEDVAAYCLNHREAVILSELDLHTEEGIHLTSLVGLPIITQDKALGVLIVINKDGGESFTEEDREILSMLLNFVAVAIDNSNLMKEQLKRQKMEQELAIAKQVQETILPHRTEPIPGVEIGTAYYPAGAVSGDFYDIISVSPGRFYVVIGDVSNKGVPAALVMSACSGIIKSVLTADQSVSVSELAGRVNDILAAGIIKEREMFVTLFFACFDLDKHRLSYCNAGHLPGLFWDDAVREVVELAKGGPIIGQFAGVCFAEETREIRAGDRLLLFTDGLTEACNAAGELFGRARVEDVLRSRIDLPPQDFCSRLKADIDRYAEGSPEDSQDDFTILQVRVR